MEMTELIYLSVGVVVGHLIGVCAIFLYDKYKEHRGWNDYYRRNPGSRRA